MPFKSEKQRKWMWANEPEMAKKWSKKEKNESDEEEIEEGTRIMRLTKRQLRLIIREACGLAAEEPSQPMGLEASQLPEEMATDEVPVPADYDSVRSMLEQNPDIVDLGISMVMDLAGTSCERSTAQGIIDHLQSMVQPAALPPISPL